MAGSPDSSTGEQPVKAGHHILTLRLGLLMAAHAVPGEDRLHVAMETDHLRGVVSPGCLMWLQ